MKKTFAILFLFVHLFNLCGYQLFFLFAEKSADKQMVAALDKNNYNENDLVQIKLALNIPYTVDKKGYERCDGHIVINGVEYNYVKRSVQNDTMYLYCVPNQQKTALINSKAELAKQSTDNTSGKKTELPNAKRTNVLCDYNANLLQYNFASLNNCVTKFYFLRNTNISSGFTATPAQPPELIG